MLTPLKTGHWREEGLRSWHVFLCAFLSSKLSFCSYCVVLEGYVTKWKCFISADRSLYELLDVIQTSHQKYMWMRWVKVGQCKKPKHPRKMPPTCEGGGAGGCCVCCFSLVDRPVLKIKHLSLIVKRTNIFNDIYTTDSITVLIQGLFSVHKVTQ